MRVSEIYLSVQGEGPNVGTPTIFLRFGGCNLRCALWPCDTPHAIDPMFRSEWTKMTPHEVYTDVSSWAAGRPVNICLTGGEPFLQPHSELQSLIVMLHEDQFLIECFSNGTLLYPDWAINEIQFIMDWKLSGSGEDPFNGNRLANVGKLIRAGYNKEDSIKFTIAGREDYEQAKHLYETYLEGEDVNVYYGVVWGRLTNEELIGWVLEDKLPWKLNVQIHNYVWDRTRRGI